MMLLRPSLHVQGTYLMHVLNAPMTTDCVQEMIMGSSAPRANVAEIRQFAVPLPPIEEQHEIVRRVEVLLKLAGAIEARVTTATERAEKLTQSILAKAFRGELVPNEDHLDFPDMVPPFTPVDREADYREAWAYFEKLL